MVFGTLSLVHPWGVEPQSLEPESNILSIELRVQALLLRMQRYKRILNFEL